jgi:hypothetical protein
VANHCSNNATPNESTYNIGMGKEQSAIDQADMDASGTVADSGCRWDGIAQCLDETESVSLLFRKWIHQVIICHAIHVRVGPERVQLALRNLHRE